MIKLKEHITFKISTLLLVLTLVTPYAVKFYHLFEDHKHEVCTEKTVEHLHEKDTDCDFYQFKLNHNSIFIANNYNALIKQNYNKEIYSSYLFLSSYQKLHFSLRGPPQLI